MNDRIFVHISDIQLFDDTTVNSVLEWDHDIVLADGPPLYIEKFSRKDRECAWRNALRLARNIDVVILDHHLMRSNGGSVWIDQLSQTVGKKNLLRC